MSVTNDVKTFFQDDSNTGKQIFNHLSLFRGTPQDILPKKQIRISVYTD